MLIWANEGEAKMSDKLLDTYKRYRALMHKMQAGVAMWLNYDKTSGEPKHLLVGNNARAVDHAALVSLMIKKGVFTEQEYADSLCAEGEKEVETWERKLSEKMNTKITLGTFPQ